MNSNLSFQMRLFRIDELLSGKGEATSDELQEALGCSLPTLKRDLAFMRDELGAPVRYHRRTKTYRYERRVAKKSFRLAPWYSPTEVKAFFTALELFDAVEKEKGALLAPEMKAMKARLLALAVSDATGRNFREFRRRVRVVTPQAKVDRSHWFEMIGYALMNQRRLLILYYTKSRNAEMPREVSPVRLISYKNRWYLQAWCHRTDAMKTFSLECIRSAELTAKACRDVAIKAAEETDETFGIFSGADVKKAAIHFDAEMSAYVRGEIWHRKQVLRENRDGTVTLEVPYSNETELVGQILSYGAHAEVVQPEALRATVAKALQAALAVYGGGEAA